MKKGWLLHQAGGWVHYSASHAGWLPGRLQGRKARWFEFLPGETPPACSCLTCSACAENYLCLLCSHSFFLTLTLSHWAGWQQTIWWKCEHLPSQGREQEDANMWISPAFKIPPFSSSREPRDLRKMAIAFYLPLLDMNVHSTLVFLWSLPDQQSFWPFCSSLHSALGTPVLRNLTHLIWFTWIRCKDL